MSAATSFYSTFPQLMLATGRASPGFADFSAAFWTVTAISLGALLVNLRFDRAAGAELSGRTPRG